MSKAEALGLFLLAYLALALVIASSDVRLRQEVCVSQLEHIARLDRLARGMR